MLLFSPFLATFWVERNLSFQVCKSHLREVPKDLLQAAWFPCAPSQENAQDPNEEKMLLGDEGVWLKVSEGVWSGTKDLSLPSAGDKTHPFLSCRSYSNL